MAHIPTFDDRCLIEAIETVFSDWPGGDPSKFLIHLENREDVDYDLWWPFEDWDVETIIETVYEFQSQYTRFAVNVAEIVLDNLIKMSVEDLSDIDSQTLLR